MSEKIRANLIGPEIDLPEGTKGSIAFAKIKITVRYNVTEKPLPIEKTNIPLAMSIVQLDKKEVWYIASLLNNMLHMTLWSNARQYLRGLQEQQVVFNVR